jgi:myo-inositol-1(or 4)-monophosphatase
MQVAIEVSRKAGEILTERFYQAKEISMKGTNDFVTNVDNESEAFIMAELAREFPDMGMLGEESAGSRPDEGYVWIIDPVDGTRNYAWGIPFVSLVVGLALDGEVLAGVTYDPMRDEMFHAERGKGAYMNDAPIHVSDRSTLSESVVACDLSYTGDDGASNGLQIFQSLVSDIGAPRVMGSAALGLAYAAVGRFDFYFCHLLKPWDQVAGLLLVEEAGGVVTDRSGNRAGLNSDGIIASSAGLHAEFMRRTDGMAWRKPTHRTV